MFTPATPTATGQTPRPARVVARKAAAALHRLWHGLVALGALRRQRLHLDRLDDRLLADIGLTRAAAVAEARRPAWDMPAGTLPGWDAPRHWQAPRPCAGEAARACAAE